MHDTDLECLQEFLQEPLHTAEGVLARFAALPGAMAAGTAPARFVYVPGVRADRVVLVAHADTVWQGRAPVIATPCLDEEAGCFYSLSNRHGLGADDRAGCAILWLLRHLGHSLLVTDGEEQGLLGSEALVYDYPEVLAELNRHAFMVQFDRGCGGDFKCYDVGTPAFRRYIGEETGYSEPDRRSRTDIVALCRQVPGVNLSVGYYGEHTARERLDIGEWRHTLAVCRRWLAQTPLPAFRLEADRV